MGDGDEASELEVDPVVFGPAEALSGLPRLRAGCRALELAITEGARSGLDPVMLADQGEDVVSSCQLAIKVIEAARSHHLACDVRFTVGQRRIDAASPSGRDRVGAEHRMGSTGPGEVRAPA